MIKRTIIICCMLLPLLSLAWKQEPAPEKPDYKSPGAPMPELRIVQQDGNIITSKSLANKANLILMAFNPTCEHCEDMTLDIEKHISLFKKTHIVLVAAPGMMPYLDFFKSTTRFNKYPKIQVGVDSGGFIDKTFLYNTLPQLNIYDHNRKLIRTFCSLETVDSLRPYIE